MPIDTVDLGRKIDRIFAHFNQPGSPGAAVALLANGETLIQKGFGLADLEHQIPITPSTKFNIGSESKQFTALAALLLEEDGKMGFDDEIQDYLPDIPKFSQPVLVRHLLHHTSGLRDLIPLLVLAGWREGDVTTSGDVYRLISRQQDLNFEPGEEFDYTNTGYLLLAKIIEEISGDSFAKYCRRNIFEPLGMENTLCHDNYSLVIPNRAQGYYYDGEADSYFNSVLTDTVVGPTNVYTSIEDLALWDSNFYTGKVGGLELIERMHRPGKLNDGSEIDYGCGLFVGHQHRGLRIVEHGGGQGGYVSQMIRFPDHHFTAVVLINQFTWETRALTLKIADLYIDSLQLQPVAPGTVKSPSTTRKTAIVKEDVLRDFAGTYVNTSRGTVREVVLQDGALRMFGMKLIPLSDTDYYLENEPDVAVRFDLEKEGKTAGMRIDSGTTDIRYEKIKRKELSQQDLKEYTGRFYSVELDLYWTVVSEGDSLTIQRRKYSTTELTLLAEDVFVDNWLPFTFWPEQGTIFFTRDSSGTVQGFSVSCERIRNLKFKRLLKDLN